MRFYNYLIISIFIYLSACASKPPLDVSKCQNFKKASKEYVNCVNEIIINTNTYQNAKEFKKHKTLKSFFNQVLIIKTD
ncbi:hypothetical protein N8Z07_00620 [Pelagibacteraceae bacterium]|jgi:hypothetical protein|nr:hypothetical protein [Pelagibacteraceae bacterium]